MVKYYGYVRALDVGYPPAKTPEESRGIISLASRNVMAATGVISYARFRRVKTPKGKSFWGTLTNLSAARDKIQGFEGGTWEGWPASLVSSYLKLNVGKEHKSPRIATNITSYRRNYPISGRGDIGVYDCSLPVIRLTRGKGMMPGILYRLPPLVHADFSDATQHLLALEACKILRGPSKRLRGSFGGLSRLQYLQYPKSIIM
ncbi:uncharacterized protein F5147DRAFT_759051 [Suillus discolor]|uniref:Uncharacterized protein n=1 Tax=Suillus discolor TaxID=1912936 RepID=A0A9P7JXP4_9AGAM|nr:uncharacterized protein F5147DRAFT_759051 [Suillus discolor]KAG2113804.1 hypothetical protein F5147DRAFT_759051 [Suillus discolor]